MSRAVACNCYIPGNHFVALGGGGGGGGGVSSGH